MPWWFRLIYLGFVAVHVPAYLLVYPPTNFLWLSNIALFGGLVAAWTGSTKVSSMMLVSVGLLEMGWIVGFVAGLIFGPSQGALDYMFDPEIALFARLLSLFQLVLPFALFWMVWRFGYDREAWWQWLPIGWLIVFLSHFATPAAGNTNWAHRPPWHDAPDVSSRVWLGIVLFLLAIVWWVTHRLICLILRKLDHRRGTGSLG